ncbi:hypothetical protein Gferi_15975 [Geosporobacter ferrireducens]|uniref:Uncharacterized protein n=1 Tax=Geosporobacter ferrireducens TaxID=1424294 RepID=A0A1D8GJ30_9FIRM|nr:hypothetical protein Gferi_15975 [Geosporobacter ferrireducens]
MNNVNENFEKNIHTFRRSVIYSLIFTILEAAYIIYIIAIGIVIPGIGIICSLLGAHLGKNIVDLYIIYKKPKS